MGSSTVIDEMTRHCASGPSLGIAFFYFDFYDKDTLLPAVLRSLIKQLSLQCTTAYDALTSLFSQYGEGQQPPPLDELMITLKSMIGAFSNVYIIFDALDEYSERDELLRILGLIHGWKIGTLHLLATSRKERDIEVGLDSLVSHRVPMDEILVEDDIRMHVVRILADDIKFRQYSGEEKKLIKTKLMEGAHGM